MDQFLSLPTHTSEETQLPITLNSGQRSGTTQHSDESETSETSSQVSPEIIEGENVERESSRPNGHGSKMINELQSDLIGS